MKTVSKRIIVNVLGRQVRKLRKKHDFKVVAVVGSIGKTSTKFAIARVLGQHYKVQFQEGNYNDIVSVPLVFFGLPLPSLFNPAAWTKTLAKIKKQLSQPYPYDVVVVEIGTDGPGQIAAFDAYLKADITVVSAITPEHMEYFDGMDAVASEELSVSDISKLLIANSDLIEAKYLRPLQNKLQTYGADDNADYVLKNTRFAGESATFEIEYKQKKLLSAEMKAVSIAELYSATAATAVAKQLEVPTDKIIEGIAKLKPVSGRMQRLNGIKNSLIIDETYNASPVAVKAALDSLYVLKAPQKIAILGNMNELGYMSEDAHREVGEYCEPRQLDVVVTIGPDANKFLAPAARANGCRVAEFNDPYSAGEYVRNRVKNGAIILAKGSQNGVFAEEAVKLLLRSSDDEKLLVRQSPEWLRKKQKNLA